MYAPSPSQSKKHWNAGPRAGHAYATRKGIALVPLALLDEIVTSTAGRAVVGLTLYPERRRVLLGVSLSLAAVSLTRPKGPLFAACCFGWYAVQRRIATGRWLPDWHITATLVVPCVGVVVDHSLFRYGYYAKYLRS